MNIYIDNELINNSSLNETMVENRSESGYFDISIQLSEKPKESLSILYAEGKYTLRLYSSEKEYIYYPKAMKAEDVVALAKSYLDNKNILGKYKWKEDPYARDRKIWNLVRLSFCLFFATIFLSLFFDKQRPLSQSLKVGLAIPCSLSALLNIIIIPFAIKRKLTVTTRFGKEMPLVILLLFYTIVEIVPLIFLIKK